MGSVNISITKDVYNRLSRRKAEGESFSSAIGRLLGKKDIRKCFGLMKNYPDSAKAMKAEVRRARKAGWRDIR